MNITLTPDQWQEIYKMLDFHMREYRFCQTDEARSAGLDLLSFITLGGNDA